MNNYRTLDIQAHYDTSIMAYQQAIATGGAHDKAALDNVVQIDGLYWVKSTNLDWLLLLLTYRKLGAMISIKHGDGYYLYTLGKGDKHGN